MCAWLVAGPAAFAQAPGIAPVPQPLHAQNYQSISAYFPAADTDGQTIVAGAQANALGMVGEHPMAVVWVNQNSAESSQQEENWRLTQALTTNLQPFEEFGAAVAAQGNHIAIGAPGTVASGDRPRGGSVYLYRRTAEEEEFFEAQRLTSPNPAFDGRFGASVAFCGNYLVVGAPGEATGAGGASRGAIYVYVPDPNPDLPWKLVQRLTADDPSEARSYGSTLAATDNWVAVGDPDACQTEADPWRGRVHMIILTGNSTPDALIFRESGIISMKSGGSGLRIGNLLAATDGLLALGCERLDPQSTEISPGVFFVDIALTDKIRVTHQQVVPLPAGTHFLQNTQISATTNSVAVLTVNPDQNARRSLQLFHRTIEVAEAASDSSSPPPWQLAPPVLPAHLPLFGENLVAFDQFTLFAGERLLTVLTKTTPGTDADHALTAVVSYSLARLQSGGETTSVPSHAAASAKPGSGVPMIREVRLNSLEMRDGVQQVRPAEQKRTDYLGNSLLETADGTVIVGAPGGEEEGQQSGSVLVIERKTNGRLADVAWEIRLSETDVVDGFGEKMALNGQTLAVAVPRYQEGTGAVTGAVAFFHLQRGAAPQFQSLITPPEEYDLAEFGADVALSGELLFVGAPGNPAGGVLYLPRVLIFRTPAKGESGWQVVATLEDPAGQIDSGFGSVLALKDDLLAVGAPFAQSANDEQTGLAYLYSQHRQGRDRYGLVKTLRPQQAGPLARFGSALTMGGNSVFVGAPGETVRAENVTMAAIYNRNQGAVYEFQRDFPSIGDWGQVAHIYDREGRRAQFFGEALAIDPYTDWLWVGSPRAMVGKPSTSGGTIQAFEKTRAATAMEAGLWHKVGSLESPEPVTNAEFGRHFLLTSRQVIVGSLRISETSNQRGGGLYLFNRNDMEQAFAGPPADDPVAESVPEDPPSDTSTPAIPTSAESDEDLGPAVAVPSSGIAPWNLIKLPTLTGSPQLLGTSVALVLASQENGAPDFSYLRNPPMAGGAEQSLRQLDGFFPPAGAPLRAVGPWLAWGDEQEGTVSLAHLSRAPNHLQVSPIQVAPRNRREGLGREFALHEEYVAISDVDGITIYRTLGGAKPTAIFDSRLTYPAPLAEPAILLASDHLLVAATTGTDRDGKAFAELHLFPRQTLSFQSSNFETVYLPLNSSLKPRDLRLAIAQNTVLIGIPAEARAMLLIATGPENDQWEAQWNLVHSEKKSRFGESLQALGNQFLLGAPDAGNGNGSIFQLRDISRAGNWEVTQAVEKDELPAGTRNLGADMVLQSNFLYASLSLQEEAGESPALLALALDEAPRLNQDASSDVQIERIAEQYKVALTGISAESSSTAGRTQGDDPTDLSQGWKFIPVPGPASPAFGKSLVVQDKHLFLGDPGADGAAGEKNAGHVWYMTGTSDGADNSNWETVGRISDPAPETGGEFGATLAFSENHLAVGAPGKNQALIVGLTAEGAFRTIQTLAPPANTGSSRFGDAIAFAGDTLFVSAPRATGVEGSIKGAVWVYQRKPGGEGYTAAGELMLPPSIAQAQGEAQFGQALAVVDENLLAVGAPAHRDASSGRVGKVFIYHRNPQESSADWRLFSEFQADREIGSSGFGGTLAAAGEFLAVGAPNTNMMDVSRPGTIQSGQGATHLYRKRGDLQEWIAVQLLTSQPGQENAAFGSCLSLASNAMLAVSAPGIRVGNNTHGTAFFYWKADVLSTGWKHSPPLSPPTVRSLTQFAQALALTADSLICTALGNNQSGIYVYPLEQMVPQDK